MPQTLPNLFLSFSSFHLFFIFVLISALKYLKLVKGKSNDKQSVFVHFILVLVLVHTLDSMSYWGLNPMATCKASALSAILLSQHQQYVLKQWSQLCNTLSRQEQRDLRTSPDCLLPTTTNLSLVLALFPSWGQYSKVRRVPSVSWDFTTLGFYSFFHLRRIDPTPRPSPHPFPFSLGHSWLQSPCIWLKWKALEYRFGFYFFSCSEWADRTGE